MKFVLFPSANKKKLLKKKEFLYYTGGPLCTDNHLNPGISFLGAFCHKGKFIFRNLHKILPLEFDTHEVRNIFRPRRRSVCE
jgi:hypothetical protein